MDTFGTDILGAHDTSTLGTDAAHTDIAAHTDVAAHTDIAHTDIAGDSATGATIRLASPAAGRQR